MTTTDDFLELNPCPPDVDPVITLVFGTGISKAFTTSSVRPQGHPAADWPGLMEALAEQMPADRQAQMKEMIQTARGGVSGTHHYTALLHILRRELDSAWDATIEATVQGVVDAEVPRDGWRAVLDEIRRRAMDGSVRVMSTNFDDLLARALKLKVLLRTGEAFDPRTGKAVPLIEAAKPVALRAWGQTDSQPNRLRQEILSQTCGVLHLHGWYRRPGLGDLVVDPVDYHIATERLHHKDLAVSLFRRILDSSRAVSVFVGVGDGMIDDHFCLLWRQVHEMRQRREREIAEGSLESTPPRRNLWLLREDEVGKVAKLEAKLGPYSSAITPVVYPGSGGDFDQLPLSLMRILEHYQPVHGGGSKLAEGDS